MICCTQFPHFKSSATKVVDSVWSVMCHKSLQILQTLFVCVVRSTTVVLVRVSGHIFNQMGLANLLTLRLFLMFSLIFTSF